MEFAASLYRGGELIPAAEANHQTSKELGCICPFEGCKESVFWVEPHSRKGASVRAAWRHYRLSAKSSYCENRALSKAGKEELKLLQKPARNQRLKLFNRRFWEIFKHDKVVPANPRKACLRFIPEDTLDKMIVHCRQRWHVEEILAALPQKIGFRQENKEDFEKILNNHPALMNVDEETKAVVVQNFAETKISVLRYKILCEVVEWLGSDSALESFGKLICLSFIDCLELVPPPIHSQFIAEMVITSLVLTDWEAGIESLEDKTRAIGFG
jgi:hypothetical protein